MEKTKQWGRRNKGLSSKVFVVLSFLSSLPPLVCFSSLSSIDLFPNFTYSLFDFTNVPVILLDWPCCRLSIFLLFLSIHPVFGPSSFCIAPSRNSSIALSLPSPSPPFLLLLFSLSSSPSCLFFSQFSSLQTSFATFPSFPTCLVIPRSHFSVCISSCDFCYVIFHVFLLSPLHVPHPTHPAETFGNRLVICSPWNVQNRNRG